MDMSLFIEQKNIRRKRNEAAYIIAALLLAGTFFLVVTEQLRLAWRPADAFRGGLITGLISAWNHVRDTFGTTSFVLIRRIAGTDGGYGLFLTVLLILTAVLAWLCVRSRTIGMLLIFILPPVLLSLVFGLSTEPRAVVLFVTALIGALIVMRMDGGILQAAVTAALLAGVMAAVFAGPAAGRVPFTGGTGSGGNALSGKSDFVVAS